MPHLHISLDVISGDKNDPIGVLIKLGWVIMRGKFTAYKKVSSNSIIRSHNTLENTEQWFWEVNSYGTVAKNIHHCVTINDDATKCIDVAKLKSDPWWFVAPDVLYNKGFPIDSIIVSDINN